MGSIKAQEFQAKNGKKVLIRTCEARDIELFNSYFPKLFKESDYLVNDPEEYSPNKNMGKRISESKESPLSLILVAIFEDKLIGESGVFPVKDLKRLKHRASFGISIDKDWRGVGLGKKMMELCMDWVKRPENGIEKVELKVADKHETAISLYKQFGFETESKIIKAVKMSEDKYLDQLAMSYFVSN